MGDRPNNGIRTTSRDALRLSNRYEPPETDLEAQICTAFAAAFALDRVGVEDDFFDLGGDSLTAERLCMAIEEIGGCEFRPSLLFDVCTPAEIARRLGARKVAPALPVAERPPIFIVHGGGGYTMPRPAFFEGLAKDQRVVLFEMPGIRGGTPAPRRIEDLAAAYVAQITEDWPQGPVFLSSFCAGALTAMDMARQLALSGRPVAHLILLDPGAPKNLIHRFQGRRPPLYARIFEFFLSGRFSGGAAPEDFADEHCLDRRVRLRMLKDRWKSLRYKLVGASRKHLIPGVSVEAKARLWAAYKHFWPQPHDGSVDVICSSERLRLFQDPSGFWLHFLPNLMVAAAIEKHHDITGASGPEPARLLQLAVDRELARLSAGETGEMPENTITKSAAVG
jgi:acyl carrier protein